MERIELCCAVPQMKRTWRITWEISPYHTPGLLTEAFKEAGLSINRHKLLFTLRRMIFSPAQINALNASLRSRGRDVDAAEPGARDRHLDEARPARLLDKALNLPQ